MLSFRTSNFKIFKNDTLLDKGGRKLGGGRWEVGSGHPVSLPCINTYNERRKRQSVQVRCFFFGQQNATTSSQHDNIVTPQTIPPNLHKDEPPLDIPDCGCGCCCCCPRIWCCHLLKLNPKQVGICFLLKRFRCSYSLLTDTAVVNLSSMPGSM